MTSCGLVAALIPELKRNGIGYEGVPSLDLCQHIIHQGDRPPDLRTQTEMDKCVCVLYTHIVHYNTFYVNLYLYIDRDMSGGAQAIPTQHSHGL